MGACVTSKVPCWSAPRNDSQAIALVHSYTDPGWIQDLAACASAICFTRGRIPFVSPYGEAIAPGRVIAILTTQELANLRDQLRQAEALVNSVRDKYFGAGYVEGARLLNEVSYFLSDEIASLEKIAG